MKNEKAIERPLYLRAKRRKYSPLDRLFDEPNYIFAVPEDCVEEDTTLVVKLPEGGRVGSVV